MNTGKVTLRDHNVRAHALLSASGAARWLNCTPSAQLEDKYGKQKTTIFAEEGTLAHELGELLLSKDVLNIIDDKTFEARLDVIMSNALFTEEMLEVVPIYTNYCKEQFIEAKRISPLAIMEIEQKLDLTAFIPDSFGTTDNIIVNDAVIEVTDLKYGKGVPVYAEWNKQLMLYGLGALQKYDTWYDIETVRLTIVQPRLNNISSWEISAIELRNWAETELIPKAQMAYRGEGTLEPGSWCKFCAVKNRCKALADQQMEIAKNEFKDPSFLSDEEIVEIVSRTPKLIAWANSICEYVQQTALIDGKQWPGFKLVEGISRRKWADEDKVAKLLFAKCPELTSEDVYNTSLNPITTIEKLLGKKRFNEILANEVIKPAGKPTLVPEDDKRPAIGLGQAKVDFAE